MPLRAILFFVADFPFHICQRNGQNKRTIEERILLLRKLMKISRNFYNFARVVLEFYFKYCNFSRENN